MSWSQWFTRNWSDLSFDQPDPTLRPILLQRRDRDEAVEWAGARIAKAPRWKVVAVDLYAGTIHATHATALWGFVDDIQVRFASHDDGIFITAHSQSRIGKGDLGQNDRNLRELRKILTAPDV